MSNAKIFIAATILTVTGLFTSNVRAVNGEIPMNWSTPTQASANGINVTVSGFASPGLGIDATDLSGTSFSAGPLGADAQVVQYGYNNNWNATFSQPVTGLLLYGAFWRGAVSDAINLSVSYTFNQPFTVLSGFGTASIVGNTLTIPATDFGSGILQFPSTSNSLSVTTTNALGPSGQFLTFALVPEPASAGMLGAGALLLLRRGRRTMAAKRGIC